MTVLITALALSLTACPALADGDPWEPFVTEAAQRFNIPPTWIRAVMRAESGGRTTLNGQPITSKAGAMGLMQVMPATYENLSKQHGLGANPYDPHDNILAGAAYLRGLFDRFGYPGLFAAYNAGPGCYRASLQGESLPRETRNYLATLTKSGVETGLFVTLSTDPKHLETPVSSPLFVPLRTVPILPR